MHDAEIGDYVTIAPRAVVLGRVKVEENVFIGANSTILPDVVVAKNSIIGAGALVTMDTQIPPGSLVLGSPAKVVRALSNDEQKSLKKWAENYVQLSRKYLQKKIL